MKHVAVLWACAATLAFATAARPLDAAEPQLWTPPAISTEGYESSPVFTPDGQEMYYVSADQNFGAWRILVSQCESGRWTKGEAVSFAAPPPAAEADPFITSDGQRAYHVSARHDPKNEDLDIYRVDRRANGSWGEPERLPPPVNSTSSELLPRLDGTGRLYFGSAREGGHGQGDIYSAIERSPGEWIVENVGPPVSTAANEYEAEVSRDGRTLVVVADRGDRSHLYRFRRVDRRW